ncbi:MAG: PEP-CTERM sorting domain-containing protein [Phycisphaerales bacterium]|nr:PEP-CTERM sorting domain-containing protein [Planctomycetota bacterium]
MKTGIFGAMAVLALAGTAFGAVRTINFDTDSSGNPIADLTEINTQYAGWGVNFTPNAYTGGSWATNTTLHATSTDTGFGYDPSLGNVLHAFDTDWLYEDGDPSFLISFSTGITSFSMDVVGDDYGVDGYETFAAFFDSSFNPLGYISCNGIGGVETISASGFGTAYYVAIAPGEYYDWVGIDNITYTEDVPAPGALALLGLGGVMAGRRRR